MNKSISYSRGYGLTHELTELCTLSADLSGYCLDLIMICVAIRTIRERVGVEPRIYMNLTKTGDPSVYLPVL